MMRTVAFYTLGCKVNHYETEVMMDEFRRAGYEIKKFAEKADIYIINSCTVTNQAASKSRKYARRAKRKNKEALVIIVGCYPQVEQNEIEAIKEVDLILGTQGKSNIVNLIEGKSIKENNKMLKESLSYDDFTEYEEMSIKRLNKTTRAYIKVQEGCDQFCSYCIIPYARGQMRSRDPENIIKEIDHLINKQAVKEIVLTGIHLGAYGIERKDNYDLAALISKITKIKGLKRIRLSSIEVTEVDEQLLKLIKNNDKVCPHLHLPLQSASNLILKKMNRPYTKDQFKEKVLECRDMVPQIAITTDIIVGFPGETISEFAKTYSFAKEIAFSRLHVFPFSRRENTAAYNMKPRVRGDIKKKNAARLRKLNKRLMSQYNKKYLNKTKKVIIEDNIDSKTGFYTAYTDNYIKVLVDAKKKDKGKIKKVKLTDCYNYGALLGSILQKEEFIE